MRTEGLSHRARKVDVAAVVATSNEAARLRGESNFLEIEPLGRLPVRVDYVTAERVIVVGLTVREERPHRYSFLWARDDECRITCLVISPGAVVDAANKREKRYSEHSDGDEAKTWRHIPLL
jgi:hypothetical protein